MAEPTKKARGMREFVDDILGGNAEESIRADVCVVCKGDASQFRDDISRREYCISGLCQECQDKAFQPPEEE